MFRYAVEIRKGQPLETDWVRLEGVHFFFSAAARLFNGISEMTIEDALIRKRHQIAGF